MEAVKAAYGHVSDKLLRFVGGLFMEQKDDGSWVSSLGRVAFWIVFGHLMYAWAVTGTAPPDTEMTAFYTLLGYQGAKVLKDGAIGSVEAWKGSGQ